MIQCTNVTPNRKPLEKSWRDVANEVLMWALAAVFMLTLPLSFPVLIAYKKARGEKIRGKGAGFLTMLWIVSMVLLGIVIAAYAKKGWRGLETLLYIALAGAAWAILVFVGMRIIVEMIALSWKGWRWIKGRFNK